MKLIEYHDLLLSRLISKIEKKEIEEYFFWLIEHYCNIDRLKYILDPNFNISKKIVNELLNAIKLLENKMPIQYVVGQTNFMGLKFYLNNKVLIPRPETEELVSWILSFNLDNKSVLDIGTGSGCIAISIMKHGKPSKVYGWDIEKKIIQLANQNAEENNVVIDFSINDINNLETKLKFDIIVSNPPYLCCDEKINMDQNVLLHEPHNALFVYNDDLLFYYKKIVEFAKEKLKTGGSIFFEINETQGKNISILLNDFGFESIEMKQDFLNKQRMVRAVLI